MALRGNTAGSSCSKGVTGLGLVAVLTASAACAQEWVTVFFDGFDELAQGENASPGGLDLRTWSFDIGTRDNSDPDNLGPELWGNNEPQYYTDRAANAEVDADLSSLIIRSIREDFQGSEFTSARVHTRGHPVAGAVEPPRDSDGAYIVGGAVRAEVKATLPSGSETGTWPAFWLLPSSPEYGPWPFSGELDVLEAIRTQATFISGVHFGGPFDARANYASTSRCPSPSGTTSCTASPRARPAELQPLLAEPAPAAAACASCTESQHTWAVEWRIADGPMATLEFFVDENVVLSLNSSQWWTNQVAENGTVSQRDDPLAPFDQPFYMILNIATGGSYPGDPPNGPYEQRFVIDHVAVQQAPETQFLQPAANAPLAAAPQDATSAPQAAANGPQAENPQAAASAPMAAPTGSGADARGAALTPGAVSTDSGCEAPGAALAAVFGAMLAMSLTS